ncbi:hypothetical protein BST95_04335 [Halioglobus japonicus]|uniref:DUF3604 domain-containing protein n=1 Tax=Halioglobus japonicus TaxID=930805 RepID=A0AAP8MCY0_9GAMM|nr:DUF3604 domain-containing protein [Halioglobus japonicus]AQA17575.1 hypothetical protein BST95_04335 [Halioglobus japonicus]PLW85512.1 DUF3604 domain-containing protein [Halioglobus japonicus]GHD16050.1 hypothetical protein GCM10007052_20990 [Halioglobus japonicus]
MKRHIATRLTAAALAAAVLAACSPEPRGRGDIAGERLQEAVVSEREARYVAAVPDPAEPLAGQSQILFGDLHVHTTFSPDAFIMSLPLTGGSGLHPPADACDFARYCAALDFWSINDHAEGITPRRWAETRQSIRECNASAGDPANPDMVSFLGWEWSQVATDPAKHYGHKNVIFLDTEDDQVPARAIAAPRERLAQAPIGRAAQLMMSLADFENRDFYLGIQSYYDEIADTPVCPKGVDTRDLPANCLEVADDPRELFTKLDEWGYDSIVIPHGNSWGMNTPATTTLDKQLTREQHDPKRQILFEVYSGHGNSEEYRRWRAAVKEDDGGLICPEPTDDYLPCCYRAGQIIRQRCEASGESAEECQLRDFEARQNFVDAGNSGHLTVPGQSVVDWLNCGTCPDCFNEPMDHRPAATAQYALAISGFDDAQDPLRFRFGLIGSSDNHRGQPGTGYKEVRRKFMTEAFGSPEDGRAARQQRDTREPLPMSEAIDGNSVGLVSARNMERQNSFWLTGGLAAIHASGRDRNAIWSSLKRREVYATSGDRLLLWFDLLHGEKRHPMGSELSLAESPVFRVSAMGAFKQMPGCPDYAHSGLGDARLESLCGGECYNPSSERHVIDRIEIVRIQPQERGDEDVADLISDPWKVFQCDPEPMGCTVEFSDEDFVAGERETIYYARAIQETTAMINAANLRCEYDAQGRCIEVDPCYGDFRTPADEDCLAPAQQRAWSSPIFVDFQSRQEQEEK